MQSQSSRHRARTDGSLTGLALGLCAACAACAPARPPPRAELPAPLDTSSLAAFAQGPGARWAIVAHPRAIAVGPLGALVDRLAPAAGVERLSKTLGVDVRAVPDALFVGYAATITYAAHLPSGASPSSALDAFEQRILPPSGRASPRPDVVRAWGSMPSGSRASEVAMFSTRGDAVVAESGRFGPASVAIALATHQLAAGRSLAQQTPFAALAAWAGDAPLAILARCPLGGLLGAESTPVFAEECEGAALSVRATADRNVTLAVRVRGHWGGDAAAAEKELAGALAHVTESDLGRALGLRDARIETAATPEAIDARVTLDGATLADGLRRLLAAEVTEVLR